MEGGKFDFKKAQRELIRKELRPILYEYGFVLCGPTAYIRERGGLLQEFYFKVEVSKLRPWVSYRPVFDARPIVSFGSDGPTFPASALLIYHPNRRLSTTFFTFS